MDERPSIDSLFGNGDSGTFMGLPEGDRAGSEALDAALLGVSMATPYRSVGPYCAGGPQAIRAAIAGYSANIHHHDFDISGPLLPGSDSRVVDLGDLPLQVNAPEGNRQKIREEVAKVLDRGGVPIVMGGDDSVPIPVLQAYERGEAVTVLQIDAHIDWRECVQGERHGLSSTMRRASEMAHVDKIVQVGARGVGSARSSDLQDALAWGARIITARDVRRRGTAQVVDQIPSGSRVFVSLDLDALDPTVMPAVIAPTPGGLGYWDVLDLIDGVLEKGRLVGFDVVELVPERDQGGLGALTAARIVANAVGRLARVASSPSPTAFTRQG